MSRTKKKRKKWIIIIAAVICCAVLAVVGVMCYAKYQMGKIPGLTFREALEYTTKDNKDAVITVGVLRDGHSSFRVYGENGKELPAELHTYEIGSLTKTFTAALVYKAAAEGKIDLDSTIDHYLQLPGGNEYPTVEELLTHTSGYKGYYFESPMISNFFKGRNDFYGITKEMVLDKAGRLSMDRESYGFTYSNYGFAVLGLVLEAVYQTDYTALAEDFIQNELGLADTGISDQSGDLGNYWDWKEDDAYLPAGAVTSNISDMLSYAEMQLAGNPYFSGCHKSRKVINASTKAYEAMGIRMDEIGMAWIIDKENGIVWHNGGTGDYNSYLGFDPEAGIAVVVLSNLAPGARIPATVLGIKLLQEMKEQRFSPDSISQEVYDVLRLTWDSWNMRSPEEKMLSSITPGYCRRSFDDWASCEAFLGFSIPNPLEECSWLEKATFVAMPLGFQDAPPVEASWYGTEDGHIEWIRVEAGYRNEPVRVMLSASVYSDPADMKSADGWSVEQERQSYLENTDGTLLQIVSEDTENYFSSTAYQARGNVLYCFNIVGKPEERAQVEDTMAQVAACLSDDPSY